MSIPSKEARQRYYQKNRARVIASITEYKARITREAREYIIEVFRNKKCVDCGNDDPWVLEFDHRDTEKKVKCITDMVGVYKAERVKAEIAKCEVRCRNCHQRRTIEGNKSWRFHAFPEAQTKSRYPLSATQEK
jgi:hypothetical protein